MSIGPFQHLPGSHEMAGANSLACEPWLLPISDRSDAETSSATMESLQSSVREAARPFWIAANALCVALGLMLTVQCATGWMAPSSRSLPGPMAQATPPTISAQKAAFAGDHD